MRKTILLFALALAAVAAYAAPAGAYNANRVVATGCDGNVFRTWRFNPNDTRLTQVGCPRYTFFNWDKMIYVTWDRPYSDLEAAVRSARVWWPKCEPQGYSFQMGSSSNGGTPGFGYTYFHVCT